MISINDLNNLCEDRVKDAEILIAANRFDGAYYLCGYAIELALKKRICRTLCWQGYPNNNKEFERLKTFKTHSLEILLTLSGIEDKIKKFFLPEWSIVNAWTPETRYASRTNSKQMANSMLEAVKTLLEQT